MKEKLRMEFDQRIRPAAGALTESLRVANLLADELPKKRSDELEQLHEDAILLTGRIVAFVEHG